MFDKNPKTNAGDIFVAGKTTEAVVRAIVQAQRDLNETPHPWLVALVSRFDRKAAVRETRAA